MGLSNSQYDAIMRSYSERQSEALRLQRMRRDEITRTIPQIGQIEDEIVSLSMDYAFAALGDEKASLSIKELQNKITGLSDRKKALLSKHGYAENYLEPVFSCPDCKDTGFIDGEKCHCFKKAVTELFYARSNAKNIRKNETFDTFSLDCYSKTRTDSASSKTAYENMRDILAAAKRFTSEFGQESSVKNLLFYGDTGLGKTFLSNCIANELIKSCHSVIYLSAIELFQTYSKSEFNKDADQSEIAEEITDCDLLIIDDLGTELANSFTNSRLFYCINDRILKDKSTIISTNLTLDKIFEHYSDRIFSRIMHSYKAYKFFGDNIRLSSFRPAKLS